MWKSSTPMLINPPVVFMFTRQRCGSTSTTFSSLLTLHGWTTNTYLHFSASTLFPYVNRLLICNAGNEGHWTWPHSGEDLGDAFWGSNRPNNKTGNTDDCGVMVLQQRDNFWWEDRSCLAAEVQKKTVAPICQHDSAASSASTTAGRVQWFWHFFESQYTKCDLVRFYNLRVEEIFLLKGCLGFLKICNFFWIKKSINNSCVKGLDNIFTRKTDFLGTLKFKDLRRRSYAPFDIKAKNRSIFVTRLQKFQIILFFKSMVTVLQTRR